MQVIGIGHTAYTVKDMKAAMRFYCDGLGFAHAFTLYDEAGNPWIEYLKVAPGEFVELFYAKEGQTFTMAGSYSHLCLKVDDCIGFAKLLEERGVALDKQPKKGKDGNIQAWVVDPDGNRIELMQMDSQSKQETV